MRERSRVRLLAITLMGCVIHRSSYFISNESFVLKNHSVAFIIMEIRSIWLKRMRYKFSCLSGDTIKAIVLVCLAVGVVGMSYGSLAMAYGFPLWVPFVLSITVLAGASEFMFIGIIASGGNPLAAAAAGLLVNARHVPFGVTVRDLVGARAASLLGCHIMNDESVVFGLSQKTPEQRKAAYWLCGLGVALIWPLGTLLGAGVG